MNSDLPTRQISTEISEKPGIDEGCASQIRESGWWQGSVITDSELRPKAPGMAHGYGYWVLATQICNLYSKNFASINAVEWIGANSIEAALGPQASGSDPRRFHCRATCTPSLPQGVDLLLECNIQARHWTDRRLLAELDPLPAALRDGAQGVDQHKDDFIGWIARSYTRLELSDALNEAINKSKIKDIIDKLLRLHHQQIYGVFLEISNDDNRSAAQVEPPCYLELTFVVNRAEDVAPVRAALDIVLKQQVDNPKYVPGHNSSTKIERRHVPQKFEIEFSEAVRPMDQWTAVQIRRCVRYSFVDYLSDSGLAA